MPASESIDIVKEAVYVKVVEVVACVKVDIQVSRLPKLILVQIAVLQSHEPEHLKN